MVMMTLRNRMKKGVECGRTAHVRQDFFAESEAEALRTSNCEGFYFFQSTNLLLSLHLWRKLIRMMHAFLLLRQIKDSWMSDDNSVTHWVAQLRDGDEKAAAKLWERFFTKLTAVARHHTHGRSFPIADDEDIALSAFKSFCAGLQKGRYNELNGRDSLWRLLVVITARKAADQFAYDGRAKRDSKRVVSLQGENEMIQNLVSQEPTPEMAAEFAEQLSTSLEALARDDLRQVALSKMEGFTNSEIAKQMDRSVTTIERKLRTIRSIWRKTQ